MGKIKCFALLQIGFHTFINSISQFANPLTGWIKNYINNGVKKNFEFDFWDTFSV